MTKPYITLDLEEQPRGAPPGRIYDKIKEMAETDKRVALALLHKELSKVPSYYRWEILWSLFSDYAIKNITEDELEAAKEDSRILIEKLEHKIKENK